MEFIEESMGSLSLATGENLLYVDVLNYGTNFFRLGEAWSCTEALKRVEAFVNAAKKAGFVTMKIFIDDSNPSAEATKKWKSRREKEVKNGIKNVPQGMGILIGDLFKKCGVEVHYSIEDNDDTLAFHAHADRAAVLSGDKDFFRYFPNAQFTLYDVYDISEDGRLKVDASRTKDMIKGNSKPREIKAPPATKSSVNHITESVYKRGVPTPLLRALSISPHAMLAPLRHCAFAMSGVEGLISEIFPEWNDEKSAVSWSENSITPATREDLVHLLKHPDEAFAYYFPEECSGNTPARIKIDKKDWKKHVFCVRSLVYEICIMSRLHGDKSLLDLWIEFEAKQGRATARGKFTKKSK